MYKPTEITLANLAGGALMECASAEIRKICENIADPNCKADAKRKLRIDIQIEPDETRGMARVTYEVKSSVPGPDAGKVMALIAMAPGEKSLSMFEVETRLPFEDEPLPDITPLGAAKRA